MEKKSNTLRMHKYILCAASHLKDSAEDAGGDIYRAIHRQSKKDAEEVFEKILYGIPWDGFSFLTQRFSGFIFKPTDWLKSASPS